MAIVFTLCAAYVAYCLGTNPAGPFTTPDSIRYLDAWPNYALGYPLFLKLAGARGAIIVQPVLFGAALAFLGSEIVRVTRSTWLAIAVVIAAVAPPQIREFHASILSESLFLSLLVAFLALASRFSRLPTWHLMVLIAMTAGLAGTVRRTGFALVPVMLVMVLLERHRLKGPQAALFFVAALAPFFAIVGVEQAIAPIVHQGHTSSLMGRHLFAKAALIDAPAFAKATAGKPAATADPVRAALDRHLEEDYAPIRGFLASAPRDLRAVLSIYYETCLQGGCVDRSRELMPDRDEAEQTKTLGSAALARITRAPIAFLDLMALNYGSLWTVDRLRHPDRADRLTAFIAAHRPMPFERLAFSLEPDQILAFQPSPRIRFAQWAVTAMAVWTALLAAAGLAGVATPEKVSPLVRTAAVAALAAQACLLLTAATAAGFARFTLGIWPAIVMAALCGAWALLPFWRAGTAGQKADATAR
jgi:hypothetical protein